MMTGYISLLRGINVSGQKSVRMEALREVYQSLGLENVRTYIQSGNVVFTSDEPDAQTLAVKIEAGIDHAFGFPVPVIVKDVEYFQRILDSSPFVEREDPARLYVTFLFGVPVIAMLQNLLNQELDGDEFIVGHQEIYLFCPGGYGRTKLSNTFFEKKLGVLATTRNWNTVNALVALTKEKF